MACMHEFIIILILGLKVVIIAIYCTYICSDVMKTYVCIMWYI